MGLIRISVITLLALNLLLLGVLASRPQLPVADPAVTETRSTANIQPIVLISELGDAGSDDLARQCFTVGPFESDLTVEAIVDMLGEYTTSAHSRKTEAFVDRGYWAYLPAFASEREARQAIRALLDAGHDDVSLMTDGEYDLSVSLGYFINQSNASQLIEKVRALGFEAEMRVQRDDESRYWVDYEQQAGVEYASRMLAEFVPEALHHALGCGEEQQSPVHSNQESSPIQHT